MQFDIMNTVNKSTGFSPFQLRMRQSPHLVPPLLPVLEQVGLEEETPQRVIDRLAVNMAMAQDNLVQAKIQQAAQANKSCLNDCKFQIGVRVLVCTQDK